jgi:hypothetical protein
MNLRVSNIFENFSVCLTPLCPSGQSSWLHIHRPGFDSRRYQIFWEVVGQERGPLSLMSAIEELLGRKSSDSGLEIREYGRRDPSHGTLYPQKLALTSPTSGGRSVGIVRSRTQVTSPPPRADGLAASLGGGHRSVTKAVSSTHRTVWVPIWLSLPGFLERIFACTAFCWAPRSRRLRRKCANTD